MPASEYISWQAYFEIYPFTFQQNDLHAATLTAAVYNASIRHKHIFSASDFLPKYLHERRAANKSIEQQSREFMNFKNSLRAVTQTVLGKTNDGP